MKVLKSHERLLHQEQYKSFSIMHRRLLLRVVEVKHDIQEQDTRKLLSASPADRRQNAADRDLELLHGHARIFHRDVLTASRHAQEQEDRDLDFGTVAGSSSASDTTQPTATWYSIITPQAGTSSDQDADADSESNSSELTSDKPFLAVAHVRENAEGEETNTDEETYRRILIMENRNKRMIMIDPNLRYLNKESELTNESSLIELSKAGETLFKATDPEDLEGYEKIASEQNPSWIDSMIQSMAQLSAGVGKGMV